MATTTIQGVGGGYSPISGFNSKVFSWAATLNLQNTENTGFSDNGYKSSNCTKVWISGSAAGQGQYDASSTAPIPSTLLASTADHTAAKGSMTLTARTNCTLAFTGVMTSVPMSRPNDGNFDVNHNFESSGQITQAWDETSGG